MRKIKGIPKIIKITKIADFKVYCIYHNGEDRIIDFHKIFAAWDFEKMPFKKALKDETFFQTVTLSNNTLSWPTLLKTIVLKDGSRFEVPFELDPLFLYQQSQPNEAASEHKQIGKLLKEARKAQGLTQEELAKKCGTSKNYISRIENAQSDIELTTLFKIIEVGLGKKLELIIR